jgi:hypothetical protein
MGIDLLQVGSHIYDFVLPAIGPERFEANSNPGILEEVVKGCGTCSGSGKDAEFIHFDSSKLKI